MLKFNLMSSSPWTFYHELCHALCHMPCVLLCAMVCIMLRTTPCMSCFVMCIWIITLDITAEGWSRTQTRAHTQPGRRTQRTKVPLGRCACLSLRICPTQQSRVQTQHIVPRLQTGGLD
jgi:hypothetical protein